MVSLEDFDPRPQYRGTAVTHLPSLLESISGQGLCLSQLLDPKYKYWNSDDSLSQVPACNMPNLDTLRTSAFKETLQLSEDKIRHIEQNTREQRRSPLWHAVWRYRITASNFGAVMSRRTALFYACYNHEKFPHQPCDMELKWSLQPLLSMYNIKIHMAILV